MGFCFMGLKNEFETAVVNESPVFDPLKFYCSDEVPMRFISFWLFVSLCRNVSFVLVYMYPNFSDEVRHSKEYSPFKLANFIISS